MFVGRVKHLSPREVAAMAFSGE